MTTPFIIVTIIVYFIGYGLYQMTEEASTIGLPLYVLIITAVAALLFGYVFSLAQRSVALSLTSKGIHLGNNKLIRWDNVVSIKVRTERSGEGGRFLVIQHSILQSPMK